MAGGGAAFAGMTWGGGIRADGAAPRLRRLRADWIPAYAGMTVMGAGMTAMGGDDGDGAGMTWA